MLNFIIINTELLLNMFLTLLIRILNFYYRLNSRKVGWKRSRVGTAKTVSRKFHSVSEAQVMQLKKVQLKKRTEYKMMWGVRAYNEWRNNRLMDIENFDNNIFDANLNEIGKLSKEKFEYAMCRFIPEVRKLKSGEDYPGKTLYEMCVSIQKYCNINGKKWKLVDGPDFNDLRNVLDNVMKERVLRNIGMVKKQAQVLSLDFESKMWERGILGEDTPDKLRDTVLFLIGTNVGLRAGDEHQALRRYSPWQPSQFTFQRNDKGVRCVVYTEDTVTKTHDGGLNSMRKTKKVAWIYPSSNVSRCPVRLIDKYMGLCPSVTDPKVKAAFYLRSLSRTTPAQWYSNRVLGVHAIRKTVKELLKNSELDGFFSNHSLRRTGTTRLFNAGVDRKIVKEFTGHTSDAVDQYQITSHAQREELSKIIAGEKSNVGSDANVKSVEKKEEPENCVEIEVKNKSNANELQCSSTRKNVNLKDTQGVGQMINDVLEGRNYGKIKIKLEIEISE